MFLPKESQIVVYDSGKHGQFLKAHKLSVHVQRDIIYSIKQINPSWDWGHLCIMLFLSLGSWRQWRCRVSVAWICCFCGGEALYYHLVNSPYDGVPIERSVKANNFDCGWHFWPELATTSLSRYDRKEKMCLNQLASHRSREIWH